MKSNVPKHKSTRQNDQRHSIDTRNEFNWLQHKVLRSTCVFNVRIRVDFANRVKHLTTDQIMNE